MTVRQQEYSPNTILYSKDIQGTADNGVVEISTPSELTSVSSEVNLVFCKEDYTVYSRIAEGVGGLDVCWQVFSGGGSQGPGGAASIDPTTTGCSAHSFQGDGSNGLSGEWYDVYTFTTAGTLKVKKGGIADIVVVAGGGGGGPWNSSSQRGGGGGGGGGVNIQQGIELLDGDYAVTVGSAGGRGGAGTQSRLGDLVTANGGNAGSVGGSGGGGRGGSSGAPTSHPGGSVVGAWGGTGGGGANGNGMNTTGDGSDSGYFGSAGGPGITTRISGIATKTYGGGGAGGGHNNNGGDAGHERVVQIRVRVVEGNYTSTPTPIRMAHAVKVEDGVVVDAMTIPHLDDADEAITNYINSLGIEGTWIDTSFHGKRRGVYASVGSTWDGTDFSEVEIDEELEG